MSRRLYSSEYGRTKHFKRYLPDDVGVPLEKPVGAVDAASATCSTLTFMPVMVDG